MQNWWRKGILENLDFFVNCSDYFAIIAESYHINNLFISNKFMHEGIANLPGSQIRSISLIRIGHAHSSTNDNWYARLLLANTTKLLKP